MSDIKFDYETKSIAKSIGMTEIQHDNLGEKIIEKAQEIAKKKIKPGHVAEWVVNNLSFAEMVYMTTREIFSEIDSATKDMESSTRQGMPKEMKKLLKHLDKISDGKAISPDGKITHAIRIDSVDKMKDLLARLKRLSGNSEHFDKTDSKKEDGVEAPLPFLELLKSLTQPKLPEDTIEEEDGKDSSVDDVKPSDEEDKSEEDV